MYRYDLTEATSARGAARMKIMEKSRDPDNKTIEAKHERISPATTNLVIKDLVWRPEPRSPDHRLDSINQGFCRSCRRLFQGTGTEAINLLLRDDNGVFFEHFDGHFLGKSAENGCAICTIVWNSHQPARQALARGEEICLRYDYGRFLGSDQQSFAVKFYPFCLLEASGQMMPMMMPIITLTLEPYTTEINDYGSARIIPSMPAEGYILANGDSSCRGTSSTGSSEVIVLIARWLEQCSCVSSGSAFVPERLLDVDVSQLDMVRIVKGSTIPETPRYIALSHCWGNTLSGLAGLSKLVQSNISRFMSGIPLSDLPKTFTDAVFVARSLEVRYLWIDCLCVVQDSKEDWERNAAMMWEVYTNSYVTLAATASQDSSQGLFRTRLAATVAPSIASVPENHGQLDAGTYCCYNDEEWQASVERAPLNERAWVLQERLLSPRIVHFAETQVFFECLELRASERSPSGIPGRKGVSTLRDYFHRDIREKGVNSLIPLWHNIVSEYTSLQLSHNSDKMIAVSAISRQLSNSIPNSGRYIHGLWEHGTLGQLCWCSSTSATRSLDNRAPSWSWGSMDGYVSPQFADLVNEESHIKAKAIATITTGNLAHGRPLPTASISSVYSSDDRLQVSAPLLLVKLSKQEDETPKETRESLSESRSRLIKTMDSSIPGYTGENLKSFGASAGGLPTGLSGRQRFDIDAPAGLMVQHDEEETIGQKTRPDNPRRSFFMDFDSKYYRGAIQTDQDFEREELEQLKPVFMPVFCTHDRTLPEVEVLRGLVLTKLEKEGVYRRIGVGTLDEYSIAAFLCALGNEEAEEKSLTCKNSQPLDGMLASPSLGLGAGRLKVEDFVPDEWGGKTLDFVPRDLALHELTIV
ncbi:HET-domain-containing protein [Xylariaceae sp. FL1651]|nr:HET-domain-containing protein [Xylariaceae sp. FL1651]